MLFIDGQYNMIFHVSNDVWMYCRVHVMRSHVQRCAYSHNTDHSNLHSSDIYETPDCMERESVSATPIQYVS